MSFDMSPLGNLSNVQASSKSCSGGAGNTGYFRRDGGGEQRTFIEAEEDTFEKSKDEIVEEEEGFLEFLKRLILDFVEKIKAFFVKK